MPTAALDVLAVRRRPRSELAPGEVLVRVRACALNHLDLWQRRGLPRVPIPLPHISGSDVAGDDRRGRRRAGGARPAA